MSVQSSWRILQLGCILLFVVAGFRPVFAQDSANQGDEPYLRERTDLNIFDPTKEELVSPIEKAAERKGGQLSSESLSVINIKNMATYEYEMEGATEQEVLEAARVRALKAAAGRLYFDNHFLLGLDLLEPYLKRNGEAFIARTSLLERRILADNQVMLSVRLSVNLDAFYADLQEKQFIAVPNIRPIISVHLKEEIDGQADSSADARRRVDQTFQKNLFRVQSDKMREPGLNVDLSQDPQAMATARAEAQRHNIDVLLTGTVSVTPIEEKQIYYDDYEFKAVQVHLLMYRVDTGELLGEQTDHYSASGSGAKEAIAKVLDASVARTAQKLSDQLMDLWGKTMLDEGQYHLMICNVPQDEINNLRNYMLTLRTDLQVYRKSYYGEVLVVNIVSSQLTPEELEQFLSTSTEPQFHVKRVGKRQFELELL